MIKHWKKIAINRQSNAFIANFLNSFEKKLRNVIWFSIFEPLLISTVSGGKLIKKNIYIF